MQQPAPTSLTQRQQAAILGNMRHTLVDGRTVRRLRAERLINCAELARRSGVAYSFLREIEAGVKGASDITAHKLAAALDVPVEALSGKTRTRTSRRAGAA